jgi:hypothetical protein
MWCSRGKSQYCRWWSMTWPGRIRSLGFWQIDRTRSWSWCCSCRTTRLETRLVYNFVFDWQRRTGNSQLCFGRESRGSWLSRLKKRRATWFWKRLDGTWKCWSVDLWIGRHLRQFIKNNAITDLFHLIVEVFFGTFAL